MSELYKWLLVRSACLLEHRVFHNIVVDNPTIRARRVYKLSNYGIR